MNDNAIEAPAKPQRTIVALTPEHVVDVLGVDRAEIEPDGSVFVEGPVRGYYLNDAELKLVLRHAAARLGVLVEHTLPQRKFVMGLH